MSLFIVLKYLYPDLVVGTDYVIHNDGDGDYISAWNSQREKPTDKLISDNEQAALAADNVDKAEKKRSALRGSADTEIAWRQDAVDAEIATPEEAAALSEWKKYRVLLMRINTDTAPDIEWPTQPGSS